MLSAKRIIPVKNILILYLTMRTSFAATGGNSMSTSPQFAYERFYIAHAESEARIDQSQQLFSDRMSGRRRQSWRVIMRDHRSLALSICQPCLTAATLLACW